MPSRSNSVPSFAEHGGEGTVWIAPAQRLNYGFAENWEVVLEGEWGHSAHGPSQLGENELSLKTVLREEVQDKSGLSLAVEGSILLPGIGTEDGAGF